MNLLRTIVIGAVLIALITPKGVYSFVLDIPHIIHHYNDHNEYSNHSGLWGFIDEHFLNTEAHGSSHNHSQEPTNTCTFFSSTYYTISANPTFNFYAVLIGNLNGDTNYHLCSPEIVSTIWQPPKA